MERKAKSELNPSLGKGEVESSILSGSTSFKAIPARFRGSSRTVAHRCALPIGANLAQPVPLWFHQMVAARAAAEEERFQRWLYRLERTKP